MGNKGSYVIKNFVTLSYDFVVEYITYRPQSAFRVNGETVFSYDEFHITDNGIHGTSLGLLRVHTSLVNWAWRHLHMFFFMCQQKPRFQRAYSALKAVPLPTAVYKSRCSILFCKKQILCLIYEQVSVIYFYLSLMPFSQ